MTIDLLEESADFHIVGCDKCGAITTVAINGQGIDGDEVHVAWHEAHPELDDRDR